MLSRMIVVLLLSAASLAGPALAADPLAPEGGIVHVPAFDLPLSAALSPEAQAYFSKTPTLPPSMAAAGQAKSQAEYDAAMRSYYDLADDQYAKPLYEKTIRAYPVTETVTQIAGVPVVDIRPKEGVSARNQSRVLINLRGG